MSISGLSSSTPSPSTGWQQWQTALQRRQDFSELALALDSGDVAGAQKALADLKGLQQGSSIADPVQNDLAALGQALASNNLTQAQNDFAQLQNDIQGAQSGSQATSGTRSRHHHHHHQVNNSQNSTGATSTGSTTSSTDSTTSDSATGTTVNLTA